MKSPYFNIGRAQKVIDSKWGLTSQDDKDSLPFTHAMTDEQSRRSRSRSPTRASRPSRGGFRWKDSRRRDNARDDPGRRRDFRDGPRDRDRERDGYQRGDRDDGRDQYRDRDRNRDRDRDRDEPRRGSDRLRSPRRDNRDSKDEGDVKREKKSKPAAAAAAPAVGAEEEMIVVNVNDRLGSKSAVPCLPSDTVGQFKIMVAARIGREPNQIMLKRQGERPFKDHITLEDYGISNGVQLDLEIDTGD
ncbi:hypothetical protein C2857_005438 [Epichloe festucae Fl1]|uniref:Ubiquitin-like modifier HUB1 n=1 Tax=Epichloe festucae (strain Fl1) TaxID=877507 RepID=A0A7S9KST6_EPIFF|nr:hypothetical protein C2857_005438 [Epichloe festucae Fl1]